jgi:single-strand DNA-binding protein
MTIVGRLTKDAVVAQLKDEREVVNFSVALNDFYKPKNGEAVKVTTFINCSYWMNSKMADRLKKGSLIELSGRIYVTAYTDLNGNAKASLNCHVNTIKIHQWSKQTEVIETATDKEEKEDLPF